MSFEGDPELRELFRQEVTDRVAELARGSRAMISGDLTDELAGAMFREGHTIKGTARVMGFEAISRAGQVIEQVWRNVQHGEQEPSVELGTALDALAAAIPGTLVEDADEDSLHAALVEVNALLGRESEAAAEEPPADPPTSPDEPTPVPEEPHAAEEPQPIEDVSEVADQPQPVEELPEVAEEPESVEDAPQIAEETTPVGEPAAETDGQEAVAPSVEPHEEPSPEEAVEPDLDFAGEEKEGDQPEAEPVAEPAAEEVAEPVAEEVAEPVAEEVAEEAAEEVAEDVVPAAAGEQDTAGAADGKLPPDEDPAAIELGGLLNALETWASEETARVNAAQMYQLINIVASLGIHAELLNEMVLELADAAKGNKATEQVKRLAAVVDSLEISIGNARDTALTLASAKLAEVTNAFPQLIGYLAKKTGKEIRFEIIGDDVSVDRQILERLADPIRQLLVNSVEHGIEPPAEREAAGKPPTSTLALKAIVKDHRLEVVVTDDGRGVDWESVHRTALRKELLPHDAPAEEGALRALLFAPGFSTSVEPSELVSDGTGLTTVAEEVEQLHGSLDFETSLGQGTRITIAVPTSRALQDAVIVRAASHQWGIPEAAVADTFQLDPDDIGYEGGRAEISWMDQRIPASTFAAAVGLAETDNTDEAIVVRSPVGPVALTVPEILGQRQVAAKELAPILGGTPHLTGAALLGSGDVVVLVDPSRLAERAREFPIGGEARPRVLVVDDSQGARQVVAGALASNGFEASVAGSTEEALQIISLTPVDALVVDFNMPGSDGVALIEEVRTTFGPLPIVMLSGVATPDDQERARDAGVDAYYDKADFREGALATTLRGLVDASRTAKS